MSADTRPRATTLIPKLCMMFSNALHLIQKGARDYASVERLLHAFQVFKDPNLAEQLPSGRVTFSELIDRRQKLKEYVAKAGPKCHVLLYDELLKSVTAQAQNAIRKSFPSLFLLLSAEPRWVSDLKRVTYSSLDKLEEALARMGLHLDMTVEDILDVFPEIDESNNATGPDTILYDYGETASVAQINRFKLKAVGEGYDVGWGKTETEALAMFIRDNPHYFRLRIKRVSAKPPNWMQKRIDEKVRRSFSDSR